MSIIDNQTSNYLKRAAKNYCIMVGVHLMPKGNHDVSPADLLILCINSLTTQFVPVAVYLSISFETTELKTEFRKRIVRSRHLTVITSKEKKTMLRHISDILSSMNDDTFDRHHEFIMFCEPTDNYNQYRTAIHIERTNNIPVPEGKEFAGLIEIKKDENLVQEYWRYCVHIKIVRQFFARLMCSEAGSGELIDYPQGDCLFATYLRQLAGKYLFFRYENTMVTFRENFDLDDTFSEVPNIKYAKENLYLFLLMGACDEKKILIRDLISGFEDGKSKLELYKFKNHIENIMKFVCDRPIE